MRRKNSAHAQRDAVFYMLFMFRCSTTGIKEWSQMLNSGDVGNAPSLREWNLINLQVRATSSLFVCEMFTCGRKTPVFSPRLSNFRWNYKRPLVSVGFKGLPANMETIDMGEPYLCAFHLPLHTCTPYTHTHTNTQTLTLFRFLPLTPSKKVSSFYWML